MLLIHQLNTGNLSPAELDWASAQLRAWSRKLELDAVPRSPEGFFVDVAGKRGLVRRTGNDSGSMLRYLDTTPLAEQLERAMHALRQAEIADRAPPPRSTSSAIAILEKVRPVVAPNLNADLRRDPRTPVTVAAKVRVGLARICASSRAKDARRARERRRTPAPSRSRCTRSPTARARSARRVPDEHDSLAASISLVQRSDVAGQGPQRRRPAHRRVGRHRPEPRAGRARRGAPVRRVDWVLGVVRRLNKVSNDEVEAGVSIIAERIVPVTLHAQARGEGGHRHRRQRHRRVDDGRALRRRSTCRRRRGPTSRSR